MKDLVERAVHFATQAHRRIDQRRKYTSQLVEVHLKAVASTVAEVTADPAMIAAAWLHDVVEDTPATLDDIEREFGRDVRVLVAELTDISRTTDGNRAKRKALDREHLSRASPRGKTIKLADLIDNCPDICKHDARFGRTFLTEMGALLAVLGEGDSKLLERARRVHRKWAERLGVAPTAAEPETSDGLMSDWDREFRGSQTLRLFARVFVASDIAEPLRSFDEARSMAGVAALVEDDSLPVVGVRARGRVVAYLAAVDAHRAGDTCGAARREFASNQVVDGHAPISVVIDALTHHDACFVRVLGEVNGFITRAEMQNPIVRMWLFGIITFVEIQMHERIRELWTEEEWTAKLSRGRLKKARELRDERLRRGEPCELVDCLQLADRAQLLNEDEGQRTAFGFASKGAAERVAKELQSLRNKLAHSQDIVKHDWTPIARMARRIEMLDFDR